MHPSVKTIFLVLLMILSMVEAFIKLQAEALVGTEVVDPPTDRRAKTNLKNKSNSQSDDHIREVEEQAEEVEATERRPFHRL